MPVTGFKSSKGQALFCYLAVSRKRFTRSVLAGMFWMDMPEIQALTNLRKVLNRMKPLSAYLLVERDTLAFNFEAPHSLDVKEFESASADRANIQQMQYAVSLYTGDFLDGFDDDEIPLFADWVRSQRGRLRQAAINNLQTLIKHFSERHNYTEAISFARQLLTIEPWNEEAHRDLMHLLSLSGQRSAAIKQYELCRRILKEELDVEPAQATLHLYQQIITEKLSEIETAANASSFPSANLLHNLPALATPLIGRLNECATLKTYLADPQIRLVSIAGAGGMGKTHLAVSLAHEIAAGRQWFEGVFYIPLGGVTARQDLISGMAAHLKLSLSGSRDPEKLLLSYLADKNFLLVLDNFEQLQPEEDLLEKILEAAPGSKLLITTRERIKLLQEWVVDLYGLPYPGSMHDIWAKDADAVKLFNQCARQRLADFSLEQNFQEVVRICQLVQGMPLALELAASWIRVMTAAEIADQIALSYHALSTELRNLPYRHSTMQAVFDSSWQRISAEEQAVLRTLAVFRSGFSLEAAKQVAGASLPVLSALVDKSLLNLDTRSKETTRYEMHELIRQYAADQLEANGETTQAQDSHLAYFLFLVEQAEQFWDTAKEGEWLERFEIERSNLHAALRRALDQGKIGILLRMNAALFTFWMYKSPAGEASDWLEASLALAWDEGQTDVVRSRAKVLNVAGYAALQTSEYQHAQKRFEEGLELYSRLGDQQEVAWSLRGCGFACMIKGDYARAQPYVEHSLAICQEIQDDWGTAWSIYDLGYLALTRGDWPAARGLIEDAHQRFQQLGILWGEFRSLIALGDVLRGQEQCMQASAFYREALVFQQKYQFGQFAANLLEGLAQLALLCGDSLFSAHLLGVAQKRRDTNEMSNWFHSEAEYQHGLTLLHEQLPEGAITKAQMEGYAMSPAEGIAYALEVATSLNRRAGLAVKK
jgi:predicted ATPase/DNA-binding SARP family transcriptional activator